MQLLKNTKEFFSKTGFIFNQITGGANGTSTNGVDTKTLLSDHIKKHIRKNKENNRESCQTPNTDKMTSKSCNKVPKGEHDTKSLNSKIQNSQVFSPPKRPSSRRETFNSP
jgi:hypothetical protein